MKAILVIDVPNDANLDEIHTDVALYDGGVDGTAFHPLYVKGKLKPMPDKKKINTNDISYNYGFTSGWNRCLEELEK